MQVFARLFSGSKSCSHKFFNNLRHTLQCFLHSFKAKPVIAQTKKQQQATSLCHSLVPHTYGEL